MKKLVRLTAAGISAAMLLTTMPVCAVYDSREEIAFSLRALSAGEGVYIPEDHPNLIYVTPEAAAAGVSLHTGIYIETEKPEMIFLSMRLEPDTDSIQFDGENFVNPVHIVSDEPVTYELPDGTTFSTKTTPYCFGNINSIGVYTSGAFSLDVNFKSEENALLTTWMHGTNNSTSFLGGASDTYSFIEFDVSLTPGILPGTHSIDYIEDLSVVPLSKGPTYVSTDTTTDMISSYSYIVPTLKGLQIVVGNCMMEEAVAPVFRFAEDTSSFSPAEFEGELLLGQELHTMPMTAAGLTFSGIQNPAGFDIGMPQQVDVPLQYEGMPVLTKDGKPAALQYCIGKRGDADGNGIVDAADAAKILVYAAAKGSGEARMTNGTDTEEAFALFLADVSENAPDAKTGMHDPDASDAAMILQYAAIDGSGAVPDWGQILAEN